jgi:hypothetical protein
MKKALFCLSLIFSMTLFGQDSPVDHMNQLYENYEQISKDTWDYIRQASRGKNANKIEKRRNELATTLRTSKYEANKVSTYKGDASLKIAVVNYLNLSYLVINDNYKKIVNMESIAEESYDAMEAYLLTKERVNDKMDSAFSVLQTAIDSFAATHNVTINESDNSRISKKLKNASRVNKYDNKVYLLFFKSSFYDEQMITAQNEGKIGDIEQYRQTLEITSKEGMDLLKEISGFEGDNSLKDACFKMLEFYYGEAVRYTPKQVDFYQKKDKMEVSLKNYQSKNKKSLTQKDVDEYNNAVNEYNEAIKSFNETNDYLNKYRTLRLDNFNKVRDDFFNKYL